jgi:hypothetical protein
MSGKRRKYTPEFREQAARPVIETGRPVAHVAAVAAVVYLLVSKRLFGLRGGRGKMSACQGAYSGQPVECPPRGDSGHAGAVLWPRVSICPSA